MSINRLTYLRQLREWLMTSYSPSCTTAESKPRPVIGLVLAIILTTLWQRTFEYAGPQLDLTYRITVTSGLSGQDRFYYFYHYLGLYPLYAEGIEPIFNQAGAASIIQDHPEALRMEAGYLFRAGDPGKLWLYMPGAWLKGEPRDLSTFEFNSWFFLLGLLGILIATWYADQFLLGILMVAFIGSHSFQLYETYADNLNQTGQVFSIVISSALWLLACYMPLIFNRRVSRLYLGAVAIGTGIFLGTIRQIRSEPTALVLSALACYALAPYIKWRVKIILGLVLLASLWLTGLGWEIYWRTTFERTYNVVASVGGHPYPGEYYHYHPLWHTIWCGVGDFGKEYGYAWDDVAAYNYATPIMKREGTLDYEMIGTEKSTAWYDDRQLYYKMIWTLPRYQAILRDKVLTDIMRDPSWYLRVLLQRTWRILNEVVPPQLAVGSSKYTFPLSGVWLVPTLLVLGLLHQNALIKLVGFTLPLATIAFLIYSGSGYTYYSIYPQVLAAIYGIALWRLARELIKRFVSLTRRIGG